MDTGALRQAFSAVPIFPVRPDVVAPRDSVPTELPAGQSVGSAREAPLVRNDASDNAAGLGRLAQYFQRSTEQRFERDRKTDVLVFKRLDPNTGDIILQLPDQSLLNLRAYLKDQQSATAHEIEKSA